jgi:UDP-N-acetylmuramoylalanine--D-glutamate ligase
MSMALAGGPRRACVSPTAAARRAEQLRAELPGIELHTGAFRPESIADAELIAISPGVPRAEPLVQAALARGLEVIGDIELFARVRDEFPNARVIGITGSNGKSTVTEMVGGQRAAGWRTLVAGNISLPILEALEIQVYTGAARMCLCSSCPVFSWRPRRVSMRTPERS